MNARRARRRPGENRERLIEAGLIEFGLFGFHGAATASIAARAGVPQPHVYANFSNKHELFRESCRAAIELILAQSSAVDGARTDVPLERAGDRSDAGDTRSRNALGAAHRVVAQALAVLNIDELRAPLLEILTTFRDVWGRTEFHHAYGSVGVAVLETAIIFEMTLGDGAKTLNSGGDSAERGFTAC